MKALDVREPRKSNLRIGYFWGVGVVGFGDGVLVGVVVVVFDFRFPSTDPVEWLARLRNTDNEMEVNIKMMAAQVVALLSTVVAPRGPNAVWLPAPPKAAAISALWPLCNSTTMIMNKQTIM